MTKYGVPGLVSYLHAQDFNDQLWEAMQTNGMEYWEPDNDLYVRDVKSSYTLGVSGGRERQGKDELLSMISVQPVNQLSAYPALRTEIDSVNEVADGVYVVVDFSALENKVKSLISHQGGDTGDDEAPMKSEALIMPDNSDSIIRFVSRNAAQPPLILGKDGWKVVSISRPSPAAPVLEGELVHSAQDDTPPVDSHRTTVSVSDESPSGDENGGSDSQSEGEVRQDNVLTHVEKSGGFLPR